MYNYDPAYPEPPATPLLEAQLALTVPSRLDQQLYARVFSESDDGILQEVDDDDYLPVPTCIARFGPADWRAPYVFWFGGAARTGLHIGIYDASDQLLLVGQLPELVQRGRCAETKPYAVWHDGRATPGERSRIVTGRAPFLRRR